MITNHVDDVMKPHLTSMQIFSLFSFYVHFVINRRETRALQKYADVTTLDGLGVKKVTGNVIRENPTLHATIE